MITALISVGSGIAVGLGLLIWGLSERSKRHKAEMSLEQSRTTNTSLRSDIAALQMQLEHGQDREQGAARRVQVLQDTIDQLRVKLRACRDPAAVRRWLDEQLGSGEL